MCLLDRSGCKTVSTRDILFKSYAEPLIEVFISAFWHFILRNWNGVETSSTVLYDRDQQ